MTKTIDQYNVESFERAIKKGYRITYKISKTVKNRPYWYSIEFYEGEKLVSGFGSGEITEAVKLAMEYVDNNNAAC